jgi:hypothetical protein
VKLLIKILGCILLANCSSKLPQQNVEELSREKIQLVFGRNQEKVFQPYQYVLLKNPRLKGEILLKITARPRRKNLCSVEKYDPGLFDLAAMVCDSVKDFSFGPYLERTFTYPIIFSPQ